MSITLLCYILNPKNTASVILVFTLHEKSDTNEASTKYYYELRVFEKQAK